MSDPVWLKAAEDPAFVATLRDKLGLPTEPVAIALKELAEAQKRTEKRLEELAVAQQRTEKRLEELAVAQQRTEEEIAVLARAMTELRREVGALSQNVGALLEDDVLTHGPAYLEARHQIEVTSLEPAWLPASDGTEEQIDGYGEGVGPGGRLAIVVEAKGRVHEREVREFRRKVDRIAGRLGAPVLPLIVGYAVHPAARKAAQDLGVELATIREVRAAARAA